jgi:ATP-dependent Clp protease ATP-binding subunit ClpX
VVSREVVLNNVNPTLVPREAPLRKQPPRRDKSA